MKFLMLTGGSVGFTLGLILGWLVDSSWPTTLWRASVAAYAGAILFRWWGRVWVQSLKTALHQRHTQPPQPAAGAHSRP